MQELSLKSGGGRNFRRGRNLGRVRYVIEEVISLIRIMLCYEINVNEQIESIH